MIPKRIYLLISIVFSLALLSCASKKEHDHAHDHADVSKNEWKAMDSFHMIMAEAFHPFRDSADLEPAKAKALALMTAANEWAVAPLPERVNNDEMRARLEALKSQATTLAESVQSQDDNAIGEHLRNLHTTFHKIEEAWYESD